MLYTKPKQTTNLKYVNYERKIYKFVQKLFELALDYADEGRIGCYTNISHIIFLIVNLAASQQLGRQEKINEFLKYTDKSIGEIAEKMCFSSVQYFVRAFEKLDEETPLRFRRDIRKV